MNGLSLGTIRFILLQKGYSNYYINNTIAYYLSTGNLDTLIESLQNNEEKEVA